MLLDQEDELGEEFGLELGPEFGLELGLEFWFVEELGLEFGLELGLELGLEVRLFQNIPSHGVKLSGIGLKVSPPGQLDR